MASTGAVILEAKQGDGFSVALLLAKWLEIEWNQHIQQNGSGNGKSNHQKGFLSAFAAEHEDA